MKTRHVLLAVAALAAGCNRSSDGAVQARSAALAGPPSITQFLVYADRGIALARDVHANGGDLGVRARAASSFGPQLKLGPSALVDAARAVFAPSVSLDAGASVGAVNADAVTNNGGTRGALSAFPAAAMPPAPLGPGGAAGTTNISVAAGSNRTLDPGSYGALTVAGTGAVFLKPGAFSFAGITLSDRATLVANGSATSSVFVAGQLTAGARVTLSTVSGGAGALSIVVAGNDGAKKAVSIGSYGSVVALIAAPHGTISLGDHTDARGAFAGFDVSVAEAVVLTYQKGFSAPAASPPQQLTGYLTPAITDAPLVGPVPQDTPIDLAIGLQPADRAGLAQKARDVSDPASASYRHYLTPAQVAAAYAPSAASFAALTTWATAAGLTVTDAPAHRFLLHVRGTAGKIGQALSSNLVYRARPDGTSFFGPDREPAVALAATSPIFRISGLDNLTVPEPMGSGPNGAIVSADFRRAYAACGGTGAGEKVGLVAFDGFKAADLTGYGCFAGLVTCNAGVVTAGALPPVTSVLVDGYDGAIQSPAGQTEVTLDIQMTMAMAPGLAGISVFQGPRSGGAAGASHVLSKMAADPSLKVLSSSWRFDVDGNTQHLLYVMATQGQAFVQGSGDRGTASWSGDPGDIRSMEAVTTVGGTRLTLSNRNEYESETTWNLGGASGGGVAAGTATPLYQAPFARALGVGNRMLPDVSMAVSASIFVNGAPGGAFGTSIATPLFAGWLALANEQSRARGIASAGFVNPFLYAVGGAATAIYQASFNDIADGSNNGGTCSSPGQGVCGGTWTPAAAGGNYTAGAGYDLATGLGSPRCHLLNELGTSTIQAPVVDGGADGGGPADAGADAGPAGPTLAVVATEGARGADLCLQGTGFPEGSTVRFKYLNLPAGLQPMNAVSAPEIVRLGGIYTTFDPTFGGGASSLFGFLSLNCSADDLTENMTVQVTGVEDPSLFATASLSNKWICGAMPRQNASNLTPLPIPLTTTTTCPLPPE